MNIIELLYAQREESDRVGKFDEHLNSVSEVNREITKRQHRIDFLKKHLFGVNQRPNQREIEKLEEEIGELETLLRGYREPQT